MQHQPSFFDWRAFLNGRDRHLGFGFCFSQGIPNDTSLLMRVRPWGNIFHWVCHDPSPYLSIIYQLHLFRIDLVMLKIVFDKVRVCHVSFHQTGRRASGIPQALHRQGWSLQTICQCRWWQLRFFLSLRSMILWSPKSSHHSTTSMPTSPWRSKRS